MHITQWAEYGIHCCMVLAERHTKGASSVSASELAENQSIALDYVHQILQRLRKGGLIESLRGPSGGYKLLKKPSELTLFDIISAAEGHTFEVICDNKPINIDRCASDNFCSLRPVWINLREHINVYLKGITLEQLIQNSLKINTLSNRDDQKSCVNPPDNTDLVNISV